MELTLPTGYAPVGGVSSGADGMWAGPDGRLFVNRENGTIYRRSVDGASFNLFATMPGAFATFYLLDLTANATHLYAARFGVTTLYQVSLTMASVVTISGPSSAVRFDGVRIGPDGRLYAVDSSNGSIFAFNTSSSTWTTFFSSTLLGDASQLEFGSDGRVFISRTIGGEARIYSYTLNTPGDYSSGLNPTSQTLIGTFGTSTATGIRIGPDNRLYANAFNTGQVWRSNIGITALETSPFIIGLSQPSSIYFALIPEPALLSLLGLGVIVLGLYHRRRQHCRQSAG